MVVAIAFKADLCVWIHTLKQGPHRGGGKHDSVKEKRNLTATSESVRTAGRFGPEAPTMCINSSYVTAFVFRK